MKLFSIPGHPNELLEVIDSDDSPCIYTHTHTHRVFDNSVNNFYGQLELIKLRRKVL